ncbi:MAG TPA: glucose-6-phosphate isomerase [Mycobacteriales bacterium]|nr:glucose-6-phosphate isomerase [Mycobacteriales bacterium]
MTAGPGPEDVAEARRAGTPPSELVGDAPASTDRGPAPDGTLTAHAGTGRAAVGVHVHGAALVQTVRPVLQQLQDDGVPAALAAKDATLWGPDATAEATVRLGWLDAVDTGRELVPGVLALREQLQAEGVDRIVLCGMGGSSLAPEVICAAAGRDLVVLDSTDPGQVRTALAVGDPETLRRTVVVVSSKSGGTVETDSQRRAARAAFEAAGIDPAERVVVVTDPGSPLAQQAEEEGSRAVFLADPDVGGRYSALTAFGLVPAGLAGADVARLLDDAAALQPSLAEGGPSLLLGALLGAAAAAGRDKLLLLPSADLPGFGDWAEQLVAESTGKDGRGILPVVVEDATAAGTEPAGDVLVVALGDAPDGPAATVRGPLGGQLLAWEYATAVAGRVLGIDPFNQPNVQESKDNTGAILAGGALPVADPVLVEDGLEVYATGDLLAEVRDLPGAVAALLAAVPDRGYLAVMAYLDRVAQADAAQLRGLLAARLAHPVTFGWAPRFLHSTGQYHKGGPQTGAFLQVTAAVTEDLDVPGREYTFGTLQAAQAMGDLRALGERGRPVLRVHLTDRGAGLRRLLEAARG